jgi:hypothetical protein
MAGFQLRRLQLAFLYLAIGTSRMAGSPSIRMRRSASQVAKYVRAVTDLGRQIRHLEFGGHYTDTETAQRLRMQAFYEMSGATSAARRYLGQEAYFLHR